MSSEFARNDVTRPAQYSKKVCSSRCNVDSARNLSGATWKWWSQTVRRSSRSGAGTEGNTLQHVAGAIGADKWPRPVKHRLESTDRQAGRSIPHPTHEALEPKRKEKQPARSHKTPETRMGDGESTMHNENEHVAQ